MKRVMSAIVINITTFWQHRVAGGLPLEGDVAGHNFSFSDFHKYSCVTFRNSHERFYRDILKTQKEGKLLHLWF